MSTQQSPPRQFNPIVFLRHPDETPIVTLKIHTFPPTSRAIPSYPSSHFGARLYYLILKQLEFHFTNNF